LRAAASIALPSSTATATGFSTNTSLPASHAITMGSACQWSGVATITMSIVLSSSTRRKSLCTAAASPAWAFPFARFGS
jgi:hypothetical protein